MKKSVRGSAFTGCLVLAIGCGCHPRPESADAGAALRELFPDAGPPLPLQMRIEIRLPDGGVFRAPLEAEATTLLPLTQELDVTVNLPLRNYRVRMLDEIDRALASDDTPEEMASGLRYHIHLLSPLRAGHRYTVSLDAETGTTLDDGQGRALDERRFDVRTEGEREKDAPVKRSTTKRHRHGT